MQNTSSKHSLILEAINKQYPDKYAFASENVGVWIITIDGLYSQKHHFEVLNLLSRKPIDQPAIISYQNAVCVLYKATDTHNVDNFFQAKWHHYMRSFLIKEEE